MRVIVIGDVAHVVVDLPLVHTELLVRHYSQTLEEP
jgi:hypothetical protein